MLLIRKIFEKNNLLVTTNNYLIIKNLTTFFNVKRFKIKICKKG